MLTLTQSTTFIVSCTRRLETWDSTVVVYAPSLFDKQLVAAVELPANLLSQPLAQLTESYQHPKDALTINFQSAKNTPAKASAMGSKQQRLCRTKLNFSVVGDTGNLREKTDEKARKTQRKNKIKKQNITAVPQPRVGSRSGRRSYILSFLK